MQSLFAVPNISAKEAKETARLGLPPDARRPPQEELLALLAGVMRNAARPGDGDVKKPVVNMFR